MNERFQLLASLVVAAVLIAPLSLFADSRSPGRTELDQVAVELEHVLGKANVAISGHRLPHPAEAVAIRGTEEQEAFVAAMNRERAARGLRPLHLNAQLCAAASDRVRDMFARSYFDHVAPDGMQPWLWADREGYRYRSLAENLAVGYRGAKAVVDGWMHSPGHRANILRSEYDEVGLAVAQGSPTSRFTGPLVVALYGAR